jgi:hypothetical protein
MRAHRRPAPYTKVKGGLIMGHLGKKPRTINGGDFAGDIRSGMTDYELSRKYGLTGDEFERVLGYLMDAGLVTKEQLEARQELSDSQLVQAFVESQESSQIVD